MLNVTLNLFPVCASQSYVLLSNIFDPLQSLEPVLFLLFKNFFSG